MKISLFLCAAVVGFGCSSAHAGSYEIDGAITPVLQLAVAQSNKTFNGIHAPESDQHNPSTQTSFPYKWKWVADPGKDPDPEHFEDFGFFNNPDESWGSMSAHGTDGGDGGGSQVVVVGGFMDNGEGYSIDTTRSVYSPGNFDFLPPANNIASTFGWIFTGGSRLKVTAVLSGFTTAGASGNQPASHGDATAGALNGESAISGAVVTPAP